MEDRFREELFIIVNSQDKLDQLFDIITKEAGFFRSKPKAQTVTNPNSGTVWYYTIECKPINFWLEEDVMRWSYRPMMKKSAALLGTDGALILCYSDTESGKREHLACNPNGKIKHYETSTALDYIGDDEFDYAKENLPFGYDKFEKAFVRVYGEPGKEMIQIYDMLKA